MRARSFLLQARMNKEKILDILHAHPLGRKSALIGEITDVNKGEVLLNTITGGKRILDIPSGVQLPRIC